MRACLTISVRLVANVSVDGIQLIGYTEDITVGVNATDYTLRSTIVVCENVEGQALIALEASMQKGTYAQVLSNCLDVNATVTGRFVSSQSINLPTRMPMIWPTQCPQRSPTPFPTQLAENGMKYSGTVNSYMIRCILLLLLLVVSLEIPSSSTAIHYTTS